MARAPVPGRCKTRLIPALGADLAARLYAAMLRDVLEAVSALDLADRVVLATPEDDGVRTLEGLTGPGWRVLPQRGEGLTARLSAGVADVGAKGPLVFLGSDAPALAWSALSEQVARVKGPTEAFMAPCADGGYAAIALGGPDHRTALFETIPWSTPAVAEATRERARALGVQLSEQPLGDDVDEPGDLRRLVHQLREDPRRAPHTAGLLQALRRFA